MIENHLSKYLSDIALKETECTYKFNKPRGQSITCTIVNSNGDCFGIAKFFDYLKGIKEEFRDGVIGNYSSLDSLVDDLDNAVATTSNMDPEQISFVIDLQKRSFNRYVKIAQLENIHCFPKVIQHEAEIKINGSFYGFLVEEFIDGETLEDRLCSEIGNRELFVIDFLEKMSDLLEDLQKHNIVHRDLSPDNIMMRNDEYILIDPGVAKFNDGIATKSIGMFMGKRFYMSPEQYTGNAKKVTFRSDLYALGIISLEIILGYNPLRNIIEDNTTFTPHGELVNQMERDIQDQYYASIEETSKTQRLFLIIQKMIQVQEISRFDTLDLFKKTVHSL